MRPLSGEELLPEVPDDALLVGRVWSASAGGPCVVLIDSGVVRDLSTLSATMSGLLEIPDLALRLQEPDRFPSLGVLDEFLGHANPDRAEQAGPAGRLLAPCDLQAIKAAGVTFADSMLERVIEERAKGDAGRAAELRRALQPILGENLRAVQPGSAQAREVKSLLQSMGVWSQYLEVGIGADAEIFTKAQPMSAVGAGARIGIHPMSSWNNSEPEVVLAVNARGVIVAVTLGNDVNLRDVEGRSALLLGRAKDNNASCAIGPFLRILGKDFGIDDVGRLTIRLRVSAASGFTLAGESPMNSISRSPTELVEQTINSCHQYPDGFMLFLGTMYSPVEDRRERGSGFTHEIGDEVRISSPPLGSLINWVDRSDRVAPWTFGTGELMRNLATRGLLGRV